MKAEIKGKDLVITIPIDEKPSKSGKNILIASTGGNKEQGDLKYKGKAVTVSVNAYISASK